MKSRRHTQSKYRNAVDSICGSTVKRSSSAFLQTTKRKHMASENEFEPGAAQFGNFINYYEFNPPKNRLALFQGKFCDFFPTDQRLVCLDVGCNTGVSFLTLSTNYRTLSGLCPLNIFYYTLLRFLVGYSICVIIDSSNR